MAKPAQKGPSRTIIWAVVGGVTIYCIFLLTQPDAPKHTTKKRLTSHSAVASADGITQQDLEAHFARYTGSKRDPFLPAIDIKPAGATSRGQWALTGITTINNQTTATVEDSAGGQSAVLKVGDDWQGLHVVAINTDTVVFENALDQQSRLEFPTVDTGPEAHDEGGGTSSKALVLPALPNLSVRPMPVPTPGGGQGDQTTADSGANNGGGQ